MNKIWVLSVLVIMKCTAQIQQEKKTYLGDTNNLSVNKFLDGYAWVYEKNDNFPHADQSFWIYSDNKLFNIENNSKIDDKIDYLIKTKHFYSLYCFLPRTPFPYVESVRNNIYIPIPKDSIVQDMAISSTKMNEVFILEGLGKIEDAYSEIQYRAQSFLFSIALPNYIETNRAWHPAPSTVGGMVRILEPTKSIQDFIKYLRKDKKKATIRNKTIINESLTEQTKMYLLKGDEVEVLEESERSPEVEWLKIRYYGRKTIEGWIRKIDIE